MSQNKVVNDNIKAAESTFSAVRESRQSPVQSELEKMLPGVLGGLFSLISFEIQTKTNKDTGKEETSVLYTVIPLEKKARLHNKPVLIKVKNSTPVVSRETLEKLLLQTIPPVVLRFENLAHFTFMGAKP